MNSPTLSSPTEVLVCFSSTYKANIQSMQNVSFLYSSKSSLLICSKHAVNLHANLYDDGQWLLARAEGNHPNNLFLLLLLSSCKQLFTKKKVNNNKNNNEFGT